MTEEQKKIIENIKIGLAKGYKQNLLLLSSYNDFINQVREYLLTVNVAQQLIEWNADNSFKINIEYPVVSFYNNAFLASYLDVKDIFDMAMSYRQAGHSPTEKFYQKIDLAITQDQIGANASTHERSIAGIELKGINVGVAEIVKDVQRMSNAMIRTDNISANSIDFCCCGFLRRLDKTKEMLTAELVEKKKTEEIAIWQVVCDNLAKEFTILSFTIEFFDILSTSFELISDIHKKMDSDYSEVASETGLVRGGILTITRK